MKRKSTAPRNPHVAVALFLKAGTHRKTKKALRRAEKMELQGCSSTGKSKGLLIPRLRVRISSPLPCKLRISTKAKNVSVDVFKNQFLDSSVGRVHDC